MNKLKAVVSPAFDHLPCELKQLDRWVGWLYKENGTPKPTKIPIITNVSPRDGKRDNASSTNPATWGTFEQAHAAYLDGGLSGIGIVLDGDGLVGIDLDRCVTDGVPSAKALALLDKLGAGYIEISPSGTGLRALGYGEPLDAGVNGSLDGLKGEFYSTGRYLTLTGKVIKSGPITKLKDFKTTADSFSSRKKVNVETGEIETVSTDEKHGALIQRLLSGEVYHDSLRDLAAAWVAQGMVPAAATAALTALMDNAEQRAEWKARRDQIPALVESAYAKFKVKGLPDQLEAVTANIQRYKLHGSADLHALPPLSWCVRGVLPSTGLAALYGPSGSGKSFLAFDLAASIAEGSRWFNCRVTAAPVVYCALEGETGFKLRAQAWETRKGRALPAALFTVLQPVTLTAPQDIKDLVAVVPAGAVLIVDTLNRAAPTADENSSKDMGEILSAAKALQALIGGLVLLVHHTGKDVGKGLRGHSSLFAAMDAAVEVSRNTVSRVWKVAKAKDGRDGGEQGFTLEVVSMGTDSDGERLDSCVVVPASAPAIHTSPLNPSQRMGLDTLNAALLDDLFGTGVHRDVWRESFYALHPAEKKDTKRTAFKRASSELLTLGLVCEANGMFSIPDF